MTTGRERYTVLIRRILECCAIALLMGAVCFSIAAQYRPPQSYPAGDFPIAETREIQLPHGLVHINTADADQLETLPRIGPKLAQAIIEERETNGPFVLPEDLLAVSGIGQATLKGLLDYIDLD